MKCNSYFCDGSRNAVGITDMDGKEHVIDCNKAEAQVIFDELEDVGYLVRVAREEPAIYVSFTMRLGGLQDYVDVKCRLEKSDRHFL